MSSEYRSHSHRDTCILVSRTALQPAGKGRGELSGTYAQDPGYAQDPAYAQAPAVSSLPQSHREVALRRLDPGVQEHPLSPGGCFGYTVVTSALGREKMEESNCEPHLRSMKPKLTVL